MKRGAGDAFKEFENIRAKIDLYISLDVADIKDIKERGSKNSKEINLKRCTEFIIYDKENKTEISFDFGILKIEKEKFKEALKRYLGRNEFLKKL